MLSRFKQIHPIGDHSSTDMPTFISVNLLGIQVTAFEANRVSH